MLYKQSVFKSPHKINNYRSPSRCRQVSRLSVTLAKDHPIRYEETESYQITKLFLERRRQMLDELFKDTETDLDKMQRIGDEAYNAEQMEKCLIPDRLLVEYNDGRKKTLFCLAVNLLPLEDLRTVFEDTDLQLPVRDGAKLMEKRLKGTGLQYHGLRYLIHQSLPRHEKEAASFGVQIWACNEYLLNELL